MKTIFELRSVIKLNPQEVNSCISYIAKQKIDFDVYLESKSMNLQRDFVWSIDQKRELIFSVLLRRHIPRMAMINTVDDVYQIIDGKQRLSTMIDFYNNKFDIILEGEKYYYEDLPEDYKIAISRFMFPYYIVNEESDDIISDEEKINWFMFINFAGTPQDSEHFIKLKNI